MNERAPAIRPTLSLVQGALEPVSWSWFCGHCAAPSPGGQPPAPMARVCRSCGLGLLLETRQDARPEHRDAFLIVDSSLLVHGMSVQAETLLGVREEAAVRRPLAELLVAPDAEGAARGQLSAAIADVVARDEEPSYIYVRPRNTFGVRVRARIVACGPPRAALIVLEQPRSKSLHAV